MKDIRVTNIRTNLPVSLPAVKVSNNPLTLQINGSGFNQAKYVYINTTAISTFTVLSNQSIIVQVPSNINQKDIQQILVVSNNPLLNKKNLINFDMGNSISSVSGFERLIQHFIKILLQGAGTNAFNPNEGGGLLKMIGQNAVINGIPITTSIIDAVNRTKSIITSRQNQQTNIPLEERLLDASIGGVTLKDNISVDLNITLTNMAGTSLSTFISL